MIVQFRRNALRLYGMNRLIVLEEILVAPYNFTRKIYYAFVETQCIASGELKRCLKKLQVIAFELIFKFFILN